MDLQEYTTLVDALRAVPDPRDARPALSRLSYRTRASCYYSLQSLVLILS